MSFPIVLVKNLPYDHNPASLFDLFKQFGNIQELRTGGSSDTKGQAIVTFTTFKAAQLAVEKLKGVNYQGRYLVVTLYTPDANVIESITSLIKS